jgi:putative lipoprotein (rSAM/lipoprotein system)
LLALLGYSSCQEEPMVMYGVLVVEYGIPYVEYRFQGTAANEAGEAIPGIQVQTFLDHEDYIKSMLTPAVSDEAGKYAIQRGSPNRVTEAEFVITDIDGEANGLYRDTTFTVPIAPEEFREGEGYRQLGLVEKTVDITLKAKEPAEE